MSVNFKPPGYHTVTPYLLAEDAGKVIDFMEVAFDGSSSICSRDKEGRVMHGEVKIGDSHVMVGSKHDHGQANMMLYLYVEDTDAWYHRALKAGATSLMEPVDQFYGDRNAAVLDPFGNQWWFATHIEDVSPEEIEKRAAQLENKHG